MRSGWRLRDAKIRVGAGKDSGHSPTGSKKPHGASILRIRHDQARVEHGCIPASRDTPHHRLFLSYGGRIHNEKCPPRCAVLEGRFPGLQIDVELETKRGDAQEVEKVHLVESLQTL